MRGKSKPKQLLNGSYLIKSGDDRLIEKERIKICGYCKKPEIEKIKDFITLVGNKNIIQKSLEMVDSLQNDINSKEEEKRNIEIEISKYRIEMNKEKRIIEKEISTSRHEINRLQNMIENQKKDLKQLEFLFNKEVKILIKKSDTSKLIKKKHMKKENSNRKSDNKMIINIMSPVILLKNVQQK